MKIALFGPTYPFRGGIAHYTTLLTRKLKERRHEVQLFGFKRFYPRWLHPAKTDRDHSAQVLQEEGTRLVLDSVNPLTWLRLGREIADFRPDLVIMSWWISFWAPHYYTVVKQVKKKTDAKVLFICHNVIDHESFGLDKQLTKSVLKLGDRFLVHSREDLNNLQHFVPDAEVKKVFHPNYLVFSRDGLTRRAAREQLRVEKDTILFFGFVRPYKGLHVLLQALARVVQERDVELLIAGEFWKDRGTYEKQIAELGLRDHVRIVDAYIANEEVPVYFKAADLLVMPYLSATGSGVVQLAFAFDLPVIVSDVGALPEVVQDGKTGFVVPARDSGALADKILLFFREKHRQVFVDNIRKDKHRFSWENLVEAIETLTATR